MCLLVTLQIVHSNQGLWTGFWHHNHYVKDSNLSLRNAGGALWATRTTMDSPQCFEEAIAVNGLRHSSGWECGEISKQGCCLEMRDNILEQVDERQHMEGQCKWYKGGIED